MPTAKRKQAAKRKQKPKARRTPSMRPVCMDDDIEQILCVLVALREMVLGVVDSVREQQLATADARILTQVQASNLKSLIAAVHGLTNAHREQREYFDKRDAETRSRYVQLRPRGGYLGDR